VLCRERFVNALSFRPVDRIPLVEWPVRESTMKAWQEQGYPEGTEPQAYFGLDTLHIGVPIDLGMMPPFEETIIERTADYKIWRDSLGAVRKDFAEDRTPGFVTRSWLEFPVKDREDLKRMAARYRADDPGRYPPLWIERARCLTRSLVPVHLSVPFLFWTARDWMGFEGLCMAFYDSPALLEEMFAFITDFSIAVIERGIGDVEVDIAELKEDMAYKHAPMISPEMFRSFMLPHYRRFIDYLKGRGVKLVYVDCDGNPEALIPMWLEAGVDAMSPCEIAAGVDPIGIGGRYPGFAMLGGIDKRILACGRREIDAEVSSKVPLMIERGGFVPHVDHAIPPDVSLDNYLYYRTLMSRAAHGQPLGAP
jgi:hypothetical protein